MTFTQLRTFALVAELGSLRAAAAALGVSEPAVSAAVASLRADLGDPLFRRTGNGIALTAGGRALASRARELVRLADRTRREVQQAALADGRIRALATAACAEHVAPALVAAFTRRVPGARVDVTVGSSDCAGGALADDTADISLGVRPAAHQGQLLDAVPFLRYQRLLVAAPEHPLTSRGVLSVTDLAGHRWLTGPSGIEPGTPRKSAGRPRPGPHPRWIGWRARPTRSPRRGRGAVSSSRWRTSSSTISGAGRWSACRSQARR